MTPVIWISGLIIGILVLFIRILKQISRYEARKDTLQFLQEFDLLCRERHLTIYKKDKLGKRIIGLDEHGGKMLFFDKTKNTRQIHLFDLRRISRCEVIKPRTTTDDATRNLSIKFLFKDIGHPAIILTVFDVHFDDPADFDISEKKAGYWKLVIDVYNRTPDAGSPANTFDGAPLTGQREGGQIDPLAAF
ncbi:MAG: hypothetical protein P4L51_09865 [Puia sp.]|nr:hypothetical protein [Puia sp.]